MKEISEAQARIYNFLRERIQTDGVPPSVREICTATGIRSTSTVHYHLKALENAGYISRDEGLNRSIRIVGESARFIPVLGRVTAGQPILAVENVEDYLPFTSRLKRGSELFALRVMGESMIGAGILDGDIIVVERTPTAKNGEIVVVHIDDEATCKRFYKENGHYRLQPENPTMEPIITDHVAILGKVVSCIRYYEP